MPKVVIAEKDLTTAEAIQYDDYIVLIPGTSAFKIDSKSYETGEEYYFKGSEGAKKFKKALFDYDKDFEDYEQHGPYKYSIKGNTVYNDDNVFFEIDMSRNYIVIGGEKYYRGDDAAMSAFKKEL